MQQGNLFTDSGIVYVVPNTWNPAWHIQDANAYAIDGTQVFYDTAAAAVADAERLGLRVVEVRPGWEVESEAA